MELSLPLKGEIVHQKPGGEMAGMVGFQLFQLGLGQGTAFSVETGQGKDDRLGRKPKAQLSVTEPKGGFQKGFQGASGYGTV